MAKQASKVSPSSEALQVQGAQVEQEKVDDLTAMDDILAEAKLHKVSAIAPQEFVRTSWHSNTEIRQYIRELANLFGLSDFVAFVTLALIFNKGAHSANRGTPAVIVKDVQGTDTEVKKSDLPL